MSGLDLGTGLLAGWKKHVSGRWYQRRKRKDGGSKARGSVGKSFRLGADKLRPQRDCEIDFDGQASRDVGWT